MASFRVSVRRGTSLRSGRTDEPVAITWKAYFPAVGRPEQFAMERAVKLDGERPKAGDLLTIGLNHDDSRIRPDRMHHPAPVSPVGADVDDGPWVKSVARHLTQASAPGRRVEECELFEFRGSAGIGEMEQ